MPEFELYQLLGILLLVATAVLAGYALRQHMMSRRRHAQVSLRRPSKKSADINIQEESLHDDQDEIFSQLKEGEVRKGVVKNLTNYGAFVDLGGRDGLLRVKDICWKRIRHPSEVLESGQEINVKILGIDRVKMHVSLGRKQLEGSPWERAGDLFPLGTVHTGTVTSVVEYGCFVELDDGIKGLVHSSQMDWLNSKPVISRIVSVGDEVKVKVLDLDYERQRISLGIKQCIDDPWGRAGDLFPLGTVHIGTVTSVVEYGSFVDLGDGIEGLMHRSQMDWLDPDPEPSKIVSVGEEVKVKVLELDCERHRMSLGMKQCRDNPWELLATNHRPGDKIKGVIRSITDFGIFVGLEYGMDGLVHISDVAWDAEDQEKAMEEYKKGQAVEVVLLQSDIDSERISLGIKQLTPEKNSNANTESSEDALAEQKENGDSELGADSRA